MENLNIYWNNISGCYKIEEKIWYISYTLNFFSSIFFPTPTNTTQKMRILVSQDIFKVSKGMRLVTLSVVYSDSTSEYSWAVEKMENLILMRIFTNEK